MTFRRAFDRFLEYVVLGLITALAVLVVVGVAFRKIGAALVWYDEVAAILLSWLAYYGAALAALKQAHIGFPKIIQRAPPELRRILYVVRTGVVVAFFVVTAWAGWRVLGVLGGTSLVSLPWMPTRVSQSVIPIGAVLFIVAELLNLPAGLRDESLPSGESPT